MQYAAVGPIAIHLPEKVETNDDLQAEFPNWNLDLIYSKTGIRARHIAAPDECASDLGVAAAEKLFSEFNIDRSSIDFLLFCTQTPDYPLPTTACLVQNRLGLPTSIGALDFNSGLLGLCLRPVAGRRFDPLGAARRVLLITAETYSKYIATVRSFAPHDLWRRRGGDPDRRGRHPLVVGLYLRHRRRRRRCPVRADRGRPPGRSSDQTAQPNGAGPASSTWTDRESSP